MTPDFAFVWFTYKDDAPMLLRSVKAVSTLFPDSPKYVYDDLNAGGLHVRVIAALKRMGCVMVGTKFPRKGNLRGWDCVASQSMLYKAVMRDTRCKVVVKIDSDTLLLRKEPFDAFLKSDKLYGGIQSKCGRSVCGPCYMLKEEAIDVLTDSFRNDMRSPYLTEEDFEVASRLWRYYKGPFRQLLLPFSYNGYPTAGRHVDGGLFTWDQDMLVWYKAIASTWSLVCLGVDYYAPNAAMPADVARRKNRRKRAVTMKTIWRYRTMLTSN